MATITLPRPTGEPLEFQATQLELVLTRLTASGQAYVEFGGVAYWRLPPAFGLLLVYTEHFPNRRLLEQFELSYDANFEGLSTSKPPSHASARSCPAR